MSTNGTVAYLMNTKKVAGYMPTTNGRRPRRRISLIVGILLVALIATHFQGLIAPNAGVAFANDPVQPITIFPAQPKEEVDSANQPTPTADPNDTPRRSEPNVQPIPRATDDAADQTADSVEPESDDTVVRPGRIPPRNVPGSPRSDVPNPAIEPEVPAATEPEEPAVTEPEEPAAEPEEPAAESEDPDAIEPEDDYIPDETGPVAIEGQMRGFWVDNYDPGLHSPAQIDELIANMQLANANVVFAQVRRHGDALYNNSIEPRFPGLPPESEFDPLGYLIERAHAADIEVHAWVVISMVCAGSDQRGHPKHMCTAHGPGSGPNETWTTKTYDGVEVGELDFGHPGGVIHTEQVIQNIITNYPTLDGIHYDYIRYNEMQYGYNEVSLRGFREAYGLPDNAWPVPHDPAWGQWRRDQVTNMVRRLYIRIKEMNPNIAVSAATITWGGSGSYGPDDWPNSTAYAHVFQDWRAWLEEGIIDFATPMNYFDESFERNRHWFDSWQQWNRENMGKRAIVTGLGSWMNGPDQNISQIQRALAPDAEGRMLPGVVFFDYNEPIYGTTPQRRQAFFEQLRNGIFASPAAPPAWPWIVAPTTGHIQGIAAINGQLIPRATVWVIRGETWVTNLYAADDGWFGMVELQPGNYTIVVIDPNDENHKQEYSIRIRPGQVTNVE